MSALLAVFNFYGVVFAANLIGIPFYLEYRRAIIDIAVLTLMADRFLWVSSIVAVELGFPS